MYACTKEDKLMPLFEPDCFKHRETGSGLEEKTINLVTNVGNRTYNFLTEVYNEKNLDCIKSYFTTRSITNPRRELESLSKEEFFKICRNKMKWYEFESYFIPMLEREKFSDNVKKIFVDVSSLIKSYVTDRITFMSNKPIFRVDYHYDQYPANEWTHIKKVVINHLGTSANKIEFSIISRNLFDNPTQSASPHDGPVVTTSTLLLPLSNDRESITRQDDQVS